MSGELDSLLDMTILSRANLLRHMSIVLHIDYGDSCFAQSLGLELEGIGLLMARLESSSKY